MSPSQPLPQLSDAQMEIMQEVWSHGEATVTDVWRAIANRRVVARNTILTVMERLVQRGWLSKRPLANAFLYKATMSQKNTVGRAVRHFMKRTFDGDAAPLIVAMLENSKLTKLELESIAALIESKKKTL